MRAKDRRLQAFGAEDFSEFLLCDFKAENEHAAAVFINARRLYHGWWHTDHFALQWNQ